MTKLLLLMICDSVLAQMPELPAEKESAGVPHWYFKIYQGRASRTYTNVMAVGWPRVSGTNFSCTVSNLPAGTNYFAATVFDIRNGTESLYSNELATNSKTATFAWNWQWFTNGPDVVVVSAAGNSLTMTNPVTGTQYYRLLGLSMTSAVVTGSPNLKGPWVRLPGVPVWTYASQRTPTLAITNRSL